MSTTIPDAIPATDASAEPVGRHAADLEFGESSPRARAFRLAASGVRAQADRDWVARRVRAAADAVAIAGHCV
jgi:hypothetical protein